MHTRMFIERILHRNTSSRVLRVAYLLLTIFPNIFSAQFIIIRVVVVRIIWVGRDFNHSQVNENSKGSLTQWHSCVLVSLSSTWSLCGCHRCSFGFYGYGFERRGRFRTCRVACGGGVIFGPKPRDYSTKMNRKERRLALRTAFQGCADSIVVVQDFASELSQPKTKEMLAAIDRWGVDTSEKILMIFSERNDNIYRSLRNVPNVRMIDATNLNVYDILHAEHIVVTASALDKIQEVYGE